MNIDGTYTTTMLQTMLAATPSSGSRSTTTSMSTSLFGAAASVSWGSSTTSTATGYSQLGQTSAALLNAVTGIMGAAYTTATAAASGSQLTEEQQQAETDTVNQAITLVDNGDYENAETLLNSVLADNPQSSSAVAGLAYLAQSQGDYAQAEQLYLRANVLSPTVGYDNDAQNARILQEDDVVVYRRAQAMVASPQQREDGIRLLMALTDRNDEYTAAHMTLGDALLDEGDAANGLLQYEAAIRNADQSELAQVETRVQGLLDEVPQSAYVNRLMGKVQLRQERYDEAIITFQRAIDLSDDETLYQSNLAEAYVGLGREKLDEGDITGALSNFNTAKDLDATNSVVKTALAEGYIAQADKFARTLNYEDALDGYAEAATLLSGLGKADLSADAASGAYRVGMTLRRRREASGDEVDGEVRAFQAAYDLDNDNTTYRRALADARTALGDQYTADGDLEAAAGEYGKAYELNPYDKTYKTNALNAYRAWGEEALSTFQLDDAVEAFKSAYRIDKSDAETKQNLATAYNERGLNWMTLKKYTQAAADFKEAWHLFPDSDEYHHNYNSVSSYDDDDD